MTGSAHAFYLATSYAEYPNHAKKYTALSVQVTAATCNCNLLTWDNPSQVTKTINVGIQSPESVTIPPATVNGASKTASQEIKTCYLGQNTCDETSTFSLALSTGATLASTGFITVSNDSKTLSVKPTGPTHIGTWTIKATQNTASGPNPVYTAVVITVGCTITNIASPAAPTSPTFKLSYNIYDTALTIDLSTIQYPQTPLCGKTVTENFTWTIPNGAPITSSGEKIIVSSSDKTKHNVYSVTLKNSITHNDGSWAPSMTFDVTVLDPCRTTAITTVDVTAGLNLKLGAEASMDFLEAVTATETSTSLTGICGTKTYSIIDPGNNNAVVDWITITPKANTPGTYTIKAKPVLETYVKTNNYKLKTVLTSYVGAPANHAGRTDNLVVIVTTADCVCSGVKRTLPSLVTHAAKVDTPSTVNIPVATIDETASKASSPQIRQCYTSGQGCSNSATYVVKNSDNSNLPTWMTNLGTSIRVSATNGDAVGEHLLRIVMTPSNGSAQTYDKLKVVVTCTIASINNVAPPNSGLTYTLYDTTKSINLAGNVYTQSPDCRFVLTKTASWTIPNGSPIVQNSGNSQQIDIVSLDRTKVGTH